MLLTDGIREERLKALAGWAYDPNVRAIRRSFRFADFAEAFAFMTRVALLAEKADHHPEWTNVWSRVNIALTTHDAGGVTECDIALAAAIDAIAA